jgi:FSR family fosmidomycin resistance protein-like MFS transporter
VYSIAHFLVDFACAFLMFRSIAESPNWHLCVLLYNFCAFAMQMPLGILADKWDRNHLLAALGCILVAAAYGLRHIPVAAAGLIVAIYRAQGGSFPKNASFSLDNGASKPMVFAAACLFIVVCLRSYVGLTLNFPWKNTGFWGTALACAVVLGKTAGGFAADLFGVGRTAFFSLGMAAALFLLPRMPLAGVAAVWLFNMTMPITLWVMAKIYPGAKGFSFGLLTFGLFLGFLPVYFGVDVPTNAPWPFALGAVASLALLGTGLRLIGKANLWSGR